MQYFGFDRPSFGIKTYGFGSSEFSPLDLFTGGKQGVWYDPSDKSTLFQDVAGTVPVTKDGDPVALIRDKSGNGNHAVQTVSTARPIYKTDGILHWLEGDEVDDYMATADFGLAHPVFIATSANITKNNSGLVDGLGTNSGSLLVSNGRTRLYSGSPEYFSNSVIDYGVTYTYTAQFNGINSYTVVDKSAPFVHETPASTMGGVTIMGLARAVVGTSMGGKFYGVLVRQGVATQAERDNVQQYLANKSGVTL